MTDILETHLGDKTQAANGRFFYGSEAEPTPDRLYDTTDLQQSSAEALAFSGLIRTSKVQPGLPKEIIECGFAEAISQLSTGVSINGGVLRLTLDRRPLAPEQALRALAVDFGQDSSGSIVDVPAHALTAATVLPFPVLPDEYQPVLDMRIKTSADKPASYYRAPGEVVALPSLGSWFRFDLGSTAIQHLVRY